jgi:hypothetical protein
MLKRGGGGQNYNFLTFSYYWDIPKKSKMKCEGITKLLEETIDRDEKVPQKQGLKMGP